jgi:autotransporter-associated beta strand protein
MTTTTVTVVVYSTGLTFQWNANAATSVAQDGNGTWSAIATNWLYNSNNIGWVDNEAAVFGVNTTTNCIVTLANDVTPMGITFNATGGGAYTIAGSNNIWTTDGLNIVVNTNATIAANICGAGGLTNSGRATLTMYGTNSYTGLTTVEAGTVNVYGDQSSAFGGWSLASSATGVGMNVNFYPGSKMSSSATNTISLHNSMTSQFTSASFNVAGTVTNAGTLDINRLGVLTLNSGATWTQSGSMFIRPGSGTSASSSMMVSNGAVFNFVGSNAIAINPSSGNSGLAKLAISGGTFVTAQGFQNATVTGTGTATIVLTNGGTLALSTNIPQLTTGVLTNTFISTGTGSIGGTIDTSVYSTTVSNVLTGSGSLTKLGAGSLTLLASNSFTGIILVSNGVLAVNGYSGTGAVTVASSAILGGTGVVGGAVTVNGTITPGNNVIGTLKTGSETWNGGGLYQFCLNNATNSSGWDLLSATGVFNIQSTATNPFTIEIVSLTTSNTPGPIAGFTGNGTNIWTLATASGGIQNFAPSKFTVNTASFSNTYSGTFTIGTNGSSLILTYAGSSGTSIITVPEPPVIIAQTMAINGGGFGFNFSGPRGQSYRVLSTTNLDLPIASWLVVTNGVFGSDPAFYSDAITDNQQKYYRIGSP